MVDCINDAQCEKEETEQACHLVRYKVRCLRKLLVHDVEMTDKELQDLICEIEEYKENMAKAERQMKSTTSAFLSAHAAMMEVLSVAGKVKYHQTFRKKGATEVRCMFCSMGFENMELQKKHIRSFFSTAVQLQVQIHVQVYLHSLDIKIC